LICLLLLDRFRDTVDTYLQTWARSLQDQLRSIAYESLPAIGILDGGAFIFGDLERMTGVQCRRAEILATTIESAGGLVLNRPSRVLCRHALLRSLHDSGSNPFNVYRLPELNGDLRFPVFVRREHDHNGAVSPLLRNQTELNEVLHKLQSLPKGNDDLLVVEYTHTADAADGLFRKFSAMRIGRSLIPRHLLFSTEWLNKKPKVLTPQTLDEESLFLRDFPHKTRVQKLFNAAGIEYGRIDYSLLNGQIVTWEINTNPVIVPLPEECALRRLAGQGFSAKLIREAWLELVKAKDVSVRVADCPPVLDGSEVS
jgi:hypothetical protein